MAIALAVLCVLTSAVRAEVPDMQKRTVELQNLRFGMFICWSFSTFSGKEWTPGVTNIDLFAATEVDTDQWAETAKKAGMGYILFLTKHHDGFCLWDTKTTDRKVTKAALGRDVLAELKKSCDRYGIKLALYFSEGEWAWPDKPTGGRFQANGGYNPEMKKAQLKELLTQYGPIEYIWFDHAIGDGGLSHEETVAFCKALQPACFIGFNHGPPAGDIRLGEMGHPSPLEDEKGAGFNAGHMKGYKGYRLAEFTYPILPKHQGGAMWFYSLPKHDALCMSAEKIYADYRGAAKYGNVFALDVGPDYRGRIRDIDVKTLEQVGEMIRNPPPPPPAAKASSTWNAPGYEADQAVDGDEATRWGAAPDARSGWLEVDLGGVKEIGRAIVMEIGFPRTQKFAIEYKAGEAWKPLVSGGAIAGRRVYDFAAVKAQLFRLNVLEASEVPTIEEFQLYAPGAKLPASLLDEEKKAARLKWFDEAKYGFFINWGPLLDPGRRVEGQEDRRHRRVDHAQREDPGEGVRAARTAVQSREVQRRGVGAAGPGCRDEVRGLRLQAPRRLRHVPISRDQLQRVRRHALEA
jgi:alpha-L-fucosidase